jgi:tetratricopeptide (TPR) repeat protein
MILPKRLLIGGVLVVAVVVGGFVAKHVMDQRKPAPTYHGPRVIFSNIAINGKPTRLILDTGSDDMRLTLQGAIRLNWPAALVSGFKMNNPVGGFAISDPMRLTVGAETFTLQFLIEQRSDNGADGLIGWPEIRDNILVFNSTERTVSAVAQLPPETSGWLKLKVDPAPLLTLDLPQAEDKVGRVVVDTGSPFGVGLPAAQWSEWRRTHPDVRTYARPYKGPEIGNGTLEEAWADEIKVGNLTLTDVPVHEAPAKEEAMIDNYAGTLGLYALTRMDFVVDGENNFAYLHPRPPPGPLYVENSAIERPSYKDDANGPPAGKGDWTVQDSVRLNVAFLLDASAMFKKANGDFSGVMADATHALEIDPYDAKAYALRGEAKQAKGDFDGAIVDLNRAVELDPNDEGAYFSRAVAKLQQKDFDGAIADFNQALELDPKHAVAYFDRAQAKLGQGDPAGAVADFNRVLELDPNHTAAALASRGEAKLNEGDFVGASADLQHALELDPKDAAAYAVRGMVEEIQGNVTGALADYDQAIELKPDTTPYAHLYRQLLQLKQGKASPDFAAVVATWKDGWPKTLGQFVSGNLDEATLQAAALQGPAKTVSLQQGQADYFIGMMRLGKGDQAGARDFFKKSIAANEKGTTEYQFARAELARMGGN